MKPRQQRKSDDTEHRETARKLVDNKWLKEQVRLENVPTPSSVTLYKSTGSRLVQLAIILGVTTIRMLLHSDATRIYNLNL